MLVETLGGSIFSRTRIATAVLVFSIIAGACAPAGARDSVGAAGSTPGARAAVKRITVAAGLEPDVRPTATAPARFVVLLLHTGLVSFGDQRALRPMLAEAVPSLENGLWQLLPDGRMETTWRVREGSRWHDGVPFTAEDLLFTLQVGRDPEMAAFGSPAYAFIAEARELDPRTLTISWKEPFNGADALFSYRVGLPLPKHLLEDAYRNDKASLLDLPYWSAEFVGAGPYRVREWTPGVGLLLDANGEFVLGRPQIDHIELKFIPDANTLTANLLAGTVDVTPNVGSIDHGIQLRDQWSEGRVIFNYGSDNWAALYPQFVDPRPGVVADLQVRRALVHAVDRQEIVDTMMAGMSPVPHTFLSPNQAAYRDIEAAVPRYEYDPRRAAQLLEARGFRKAANGIYRDGANQRLQLEILAGQAEQTAKAALAVADYWQRLGIDATAVRTTPQQAQDAPFMASFPAFLVIGRPNDVAGLRNLYSTAARLPSNNFRGPAGGNPSRYVNPYFDALLDAYFKTVPTSERIQVLGQIIHHIAEQATQVGLYYNPIPGAASDRLVNVSGDWPTFFITWNAHEWDVRG